MLKLILYHFYWCIKKIKVNTSRIICLKYFRKKVMLKNRLQIAITRELNILKLELQCGVVSSSYWTSKQLKLYLKFRRETLKLIYGELFLHSLQGDYKHFLQVWQSQAKTTVRHPGGNQWCIDKPAVEYENHPLSIFVSIVDFSSHTGVFSRSPELFYFDCIQIGAPIAASFCSIFRIYMVIVRAHRHFILLNRTQHTTGAINDPRTFPLIDIFILYYMHHHAPNG